MSEPYQIFCFIVDGVEPARAIDATHRILIAHGGALDADSLVYLNEIDPQPVTDDALAQLRANLGSIDYAMPEGMTNVAFGATRSWSACVTAASRANTRSWICASVVSR